MNARFEWPAPGGPHPHLARALQLGLQHWGTQSRYARGVAEVTRLHGTQLGRSMHDRADAAQQRIRETIERAASEPQRWLPWGPDALAYAIDAFQRTVLTLDTLRRRGNTFVAHQAAGMPPVLDFDHELLVDGRALKRPVNYALLRVVPPPGVQVDDAKRPFMIVDPRAGHGAGIGGFKPDSQVGEAFEDGHPVYFVVFRPVPEPGQTLADIRDAEVEFLREIARRHPHAPRPAVIGNCQGGWASMLLAASAPELVGPVVINGAPMSYWAGKVGQNPMRYLGGLGGGALPAIVLSDLGGGVFDGSALVANFENLNPANSLFRKYYHLYANVDTEAERFIDFERWWGGFYLMNEAEIRWIVENLFIGNRLARGEATLGGERVDLRQIRSPIVVFASHGDNITPPPQALNWIADLYSDVDEIKARGQRIAYMLHESIGHLGIFVSARIAGREHDAITDTMRAAEALAPGLYEMKLDQGEDRVHVRFEPRTIDDILNVDDGRGDEELFASVARLSEFATEVYDLTVRPWIRAAVAPEAARAFRELQPIRTQRVAFSDHNPLMAPVGQLAAPVRANRQPVAGDNPFLLLERLAADLVEAQLDLFRDLRDAWFETLFHAIYQAPALRTIGEDVLRTAAGRRDRDLRELPEVKAALQAMSEGGAAEGTARMLCLLAKARGYVRRSALERQVRSFRTTPAFARMDEDALARLVHRQSVIVDFEPVQAVATLPRLLDTPEERRDALATVLHVAGPRETMHPAARVMFERFEAMLAPAAAAPVTPAAPAAPRSDEPQQEPA